MGHFVYLGYRDSSKVEESNRDHCQRKRNDKQIIVSNLGEAIQGILEVTIWAMAPIITNLKYPISLIVFIQFRQITLSHKPQSAKLFLFKEELAAKIVFVPTKKQFKLARKNWSKGIQLG
jgi:membrane glycosyltransferase